MSSWVKGRNLLRISQRKPAGQLRAPTLVGGRFLGLQHGLDADDTWDDLCDCFEDEEEDDEDEENMRRGGAQPGECGLVEMCETRAWDLKTVVCGKLWREAGGKFVCMRKREIGGER